MENVNVDEPIEDVLPQKREPMFNLPGSILALGILLIIIHLIRYFLLTEPQDQQVIFMFAFFPASFGDAAASAPYPLSGYWSPLTHGLLHGDFLHLAMNLIWMAAFGSPVAQRFGAMRFFILVIICTLAGALLHFVTTSDPFVPVIGASGAVSGLMGAAARFAFQNIGNRRGFTSDRPALSLVQSFQNRQFLMFFTIWMGMNYLFGAGFIDVTGEGSLIAWQAHVGGFLAGILIFGLLDPHKKQTTA